MDSRGEKERLQDKGTFLEREIKHSVYLLQNTATGI